MSAGRTARRSLRSGRARIALGAPAAAAALAIGGTFTAYADNSVPAPTLKVVVHQVPMTDVCAEPDPVDAVPGGNETAPDRGAKDAKVAYKLAGGDPVDAVPGDDVCAEPAPDKDPVDAVPGGNDATPDRGARNAEPAPAKR